MHSKLGAALMAQNKASGAIPHFEYVIALKPNLPGGYEDLAKACLAVGQLRTAIGAVSRALAVGARKLADLRWRGGIVAGDDVDEDTAAKLRRALNRAIAWLRENEDRSRQEVLRDLDPGQRAGGLMPELVGVKTYQADEFKEKVDWMMARGFLTQEPRYADVVRNK